MVTGGKWSKELTRKVIKSNEKHTCVQSSQSIYGSNMLSKQGGMLLSTKRHYYSRLLRVLGSLPVSKSVRSGALVFGA